ncbi:50S ribosomal protein L24 [Candidatus Woesearchaeota archaeon]|nr:50S ribosomal protein L24 [Candidatus Woesearchaeota archaeon]
MAFSSKWKASKKPSKQRSYRYQAPAHTMHKFLAAHLSEALRKKYGRRSVTLATGDKVKVVRGQFKGRENKIERADVKNTQVYITGVERTKKDGSKSLIPLRPASLLITELNLDDKKRKASLEGKKAVKKDTQKAEKPAAKPADKQSGQPAKPAGD